ncbi:Zinc finger protein CONSTANS-LIKE 7 [Apostasia shenzhenica]|uniref:Zinc finger protein CONSTANS-LIKE 7 n=1 Tax=Apostasia shenzhenica TaxID=1088818 RepID=A0A2I0AGH9_9ASPA|nr:Zinc finger protein CONSTANS-LIKE 7 [Apostasia shenzhenica]
MCFNDPPAPPPPPLPPPASPGSSRRSRTKIRKPKFLSLRRQLLPLEPASPSQPSPSFGDSSDGGRQLDILEKDPNIASLLDQNGGAEPEPSLAAILASSSASCSSSTVTAAAAQPPSTPSSGLSWVCDQESREGLARRVIRGRERWAYCNNSTGEAATSPERGSCGGFDLWSGGAALRRALSLNLDYEEILTAWSDRGSLYIDGNRNSERVVPELDGSSLAVFVEVGNEGWGPATAWRVPEGGGERAARVKRYQEKRRSRLFSKRIRYEVRKLNAEKRPRVKGRFVKRGIDT